MGARSTIRRLAFNRWTLFGGTLAVVAVFVAIAVRSEWTLLQYRRTIAAELKLKPSESVSAPWKFRVFGEPGYSEIELIIVAKPGTERVDEAQRQLERFKRAFPEMQVTTKPAPKPPWQELYGKNDLPPGLQGPRLSSPRP